MEPGSALPRGFWPGLLFWLAFSALAVSVRGVRWDENFEFAQVLTGAVDYPPGHPLSQYVHRIFSGQTYLLALLQWAGGGPILLNGFRNVLYLAASVAPIYCFVSVLSRSVLAGSVVCTLALYDILAEFDGSYPLSLWPWLYSNGHVGGGYMIFALFLLLCAPWFWSGAAIVFAPFVHAGQTPALAIIALYHGLRALYRRDAGVLRQVLSGVVLGALPSLLLLLVLRQTHLPAPAEGGYAEGGNAEAIVRGFVAWSDPHRRLPTANGHLCMAATLLLTALAWYGEAPGRNKRIFEGILTYTGILAALVWPIALCHYFMNADIPQILLVWIPYRIINHAPLLLLCVIGAVLWRDGRGRFLLAASLALLLTRPWWAPWMPETAYQRYVERLDGFVFVMLGAALFTVLMQQPRTGLRAAVLAVIFVGFGSLHQFGTGCILIGLGYAAIRPKGIFRGIRNTDRQHPLLAGAVALALIGTLWTQGQYRQHLRGQAWDAPVAATLAAASRPDAPLIAPDATYALQARLNHPILVDAATSSYMSYLPALAPVTQRIYEDIYGVRFDRPEQPLPWEAIWRARSAAEWGIIARRYGADHVLSPAGVPLHLPVSADVGEMVLYRIP